MLRRHKINDKNYKKCGYYCTPKTHEFKTPSILNNNMQLRARNALGSRQEAGRGRVEAVGPKAYSLQPMAADRRFGRYKQEPSHEVRQPIAKAKTLIEELRARREMLRSLDPEKAKTIIEFTGKMNFFEALALAQREGRLIVPNDVHDKILNETTDIKFLNQLYGNWVWTGTLIIYEKPDTQFGKQVVFQGITLTVPEQFQGKANCALVVEHPDFELNELGKNMYEIKVSDENVHLVENFPRRNNLWSKYNEKFRIPVGKEVNYIENDNTIRCFWRQAGKCIGPLGRGRDVRGGGYGRRDVNADDDWSVDLGVALF